jgi:hypothetical protein
MDLVRYADSAGFEFDTDRTQMYRYRDYLVQSFNADKPYDQFIKEQLAGDEYAPDSADAMIATGFRLDRPAAAIVRCARRSAQHDVTHVHGTDGWLRAVPQPQVRSDPAEGLLPPAVGLLDARRDFPRPRRRRRGEPARPTHRRARSASARLEAPDRSAIHPADLDREIAKLPEHAGGLEDATEQRSEG